MEKKQGIGSKREFMAESERERQRKKNRRIDKRSKKQS